MKQITSLDQLLDLQDSSDYADFIMENPRKETAHICNGNLLTIAMEKGLLFDEFLESRGYEVTV